MRNFTKMLHLVFALAFTSSLAFAQTSGSSVADSDPNAPAMVTGAGNTTVETIETATRGTKSNKWDLQLVLNADSITGGVGLAGAEFDGTNFMVAEWGSAGNKDIFMISPSGTLLNSFTPTFTGASGLRDLAFDGTYFYGSDMTTSIRQFTSTGALITTITSPIPVRAIAYDDISDGFWVSNWGPPTSSLTLISRTGTILNAITTTLSHYGLAYDKNSAGGPYLWLFTGTNSATPVCQVEQIQISTGLPTGVIHSVSNDIGGTAGGIAGGLFSAYNLVPGEFTLGGLMQTEQDVFCYYLDMVVGQEEINKDAFEVNIFPNPSNDYVRISSVEPIVSLEVMNNIGQTVYSAEVNNTEATIDVRQYTTGVYFVNLKCENFVVTRKVTVE